MGKFAENLNSGKCVLPPSLQSCFGRSKRHLVRAKKKTTTTNFWHQETSEGANMGQPGNMAHITTHSVTWVTSAHELTCWLFVCLFIRLFVWLFYQSIHEGTHFKLTILLSAFGAPWDNRKDVLNPINLKYHWGILFASKSFSAHRYFISRLPQRVWDSHNQQYHTTPRHANANANGRNSLKNPVTLWIVLRGDNCMLLAHRP